MESTAPLPDGAISLYGDGKVIAYPPSAGRRANASAPQLGKGQLYQLGSSEYRHAAGLVPTACAVLFRAALQLRVGVPREVRGSECHFALGTPSRLARSVRMRATVGTWTSTLRSAISAGIRPASISSRNHRAGTRRHRAAKLSGIGSDEYTLVVIPRAFDSVQQSSRN